MARKNLFLNTLLIFICATIPGIAQSINLEDCYTILQTTQKFQNGTWVDSIARVKKLDERGRTAYDLKKHFLNGIWINTNLDSLGVISGYNWSKLSSEVKWRARVDTIIDGKRIVVLGWKSPFTYDKENLFRDSLIYDNKGRLVTHRGSISESNYEFVDYYEYVPGRAADFYRVGNTYLPFSIQHGYQLVELTGNNESLLKTWHYLSDSSFVETSSIESYNTPQAQPTSLADSRLLIDSLRYRYISTTNKKHYYHVDSWDDDFLLWNTRIADCWRMYDSLGAIVLDSVVLVGGDQKTIRYYSEMITNTGAWNESHDKKIFLLADSGGVMVGKRAHSKKYWEGNRHFQSDSLWLWNSSLSQWDFMRYDGRWEEINRAVDGCLTGTWQFKRFDTSIRPDRGGFELVETVPEFPYYSFETAEKMWQGSIEQEYRARYTTGKIDGQPWLRLDDDRFIAEPLQGDTASSLIRQVWYDPADSEIPWECKDNPPLCVKGEWNNVEKTTWQFSQNGYSDTVTEYHWTDTVFGSPDWLPNTRTITTRRGSFAFQSTISRLFEVSSANKSLVATFSGRVLILDVYLDKQSKVESFLVDLNGRIVAQLLSPGILDAGYQRIVMPIRPIAPGIYIARVKSESGIVFRPVAIGRH